MPFFRHRRTSKWVSSKFFLVSHCHFLVEEFFQFFFPSSLCPLWVCSAGWPRRVHLCCIVCGDCNLCVGSVVLWPWSTCFKNNGLFLCASVKGVWKKHVFCFQLYEFHLAGTFLNNCCKDINSKHQIEAKAVRDPLLSVTPGKSRDSSRVLSPWPMTHFCSITLKSQIYNPNEYTYRYYYL